MHFAPSVEMFRNATRVAEAARAGSTGVPEFTVHTHRGWYPSASTMPTMKAEMSSTS